MVAFALVALLTIGFVAARAYLARQTEEYPDDFEEFRRLARTSVPERLRSRLAALRGGGNGGSPGPRVGSGSTGSGESSEPW